jgi:hypothetical protein
VKVEKSSSKGGAPKGNLNAVKHGFYSKRLRVMNTAEAREMSQALDEELALLRALMEEYLVWVETCGDPGWRAKALELAGRTVMRIGNLTRIKEAVYGDGFDQSVQGIIERVLGEMDEDLG